MNYLSAAKTVFDVAIVGGGVIGLMTARELVSAGASVIVLDAGSCGRESSWAGGGIVSPLYPWRYSAPITALAAFAQSAYPNLCTELLQSTGIDPQWQRSGLLLLAVAEQAAAIAWSQQHGRELHRLTAQQIAREQPDLARDELEGICFPDVAQVRNPRLMQALRADVLQRGVTVLEESPVTALIDNTPRTAITALQTVTACVQAKQFVICSGAWSARVLAEHVAELAINPVRGQMLMFAPHSHQLQRIVLRAGRYLIPRQDGRILCGSTLEYVGFDKRTTDEARDSLWQSAVTIMPSLREIPVEMHWAGLRPGSADGVPKISRVPNRDNLWINAGHFRNGIVLAPASARLLADLLLGRTPCIASEAYQLSA
jgi:glycine oxidase